MDMVAKSPAIGRVMRSSMASVIGVDGAELVAAARKAREIRATIMPIPPGTARGRHDDARAPMRLATARRRCSTSARPRTTLSGANEVQTPHEDRERLRRLVGVADDRYAVPVPESVSSAVA